ncbi:MAG: ABC transporter ATP-binding protein [Bacillota bacterium]
MIEVKGVSKAFGPEKALDMVSLSVKKGSIYGLMGPNGAGKTTLIKCMVDIYKPDEGEIYISGQRISQNKRLKSRIGYVADVQYFYPQFSVKDMAAFYRQTYPGWHEERYQKLKDVFGIDEKKKLRELSKGTKAQLGIFLNLSINADMLILDEPTSGLDPVVRQKVLNLLVEEAGANETTIFISSHSLGELERICDHVGIMHKGKIIMEASIEDLKEKVRKIQVAFDGEMPETIALRKDILSIKNQGRVYHLVVKDGISEIMKDINQLSPILLETIDMSLEEIFIYKMGGEGYAFEDFSL